MHWQSQPNAIYQVQYVSDLSGLVDNGVGWQTLVNNYPSQGTNTLWLDTGDCLQTPPVNHPKFDEARFYQVVCLGTNPAMPFGPPPQQQIQGGVTNQPSAFIPQAPACATRFGARMQQGGWKEGFNYPGAQVTLNNLRSAALGGNEIFGNVTVGFFIGHGFFGTQPDYNSFANQSLETYITSDNPNDGRTPWLRLSEFGFGGSLRYMGLLACWMLTDPNFGSMNNAGVLPIPSSLHLLCGCSSLAVLTEDLGELWANNMCGKPGFLGVGVQKPDAVAQAWTRAGSQSYSHLGPEFSGMQIYFRVAGWSSAMNDTLANANDPTSGNITYFDTLVHF